MTFMEMTKPGIVPVQFLTDNKYKQPKKLITYCKQLEEILKNGQEKLEG